ncbi:IS607 family element RNA-guided endonuclease TnpB [Pengzhenrongella sp.]|uniref:IS607 family element RNA-guided endonuclease TnpB n=1 Tax=Pengzhenrongella sp. TaxID=2888820 RepID=UPI002F92571E
MTLLAVRVALDPTPSQERALRSHAGGARVAFNWGLARVKANLSQRAAEKSYGITGEDLTPFVDWSFYGLRKAWNLAKINVAPWWRENSKEAYASGLERLARALKNWSASRGPKRKGAKVGFPRFRSKHQARPSVRFTTGPIRAGGITAVLPVLGRMKLHEDVTDRLAGARIRSATVRFERGRWFASFTVEQDVQRPRATKPGDVIGIDLGIKTLAVLSDGTEIPNPRHLGAALRKVRRAARTVSRRQGPDRRTGQRPSNRWRRASARLGGLHGRVADVRKDSIHKLTTSIARTYGVVVIEDLNVAGMTKNRRLARHVADASFSEIRRQLAYKIEWHGGTLIVADRWFASSKTCSRCGAVRAKLTLSERMYVCDVCAMVMDRDVNAALNLAQYGRNELKVAASGAETHNGRGADQRTGLARQVAVKRQPGTRQRGQTGTLPPQGESAA